MTCHLLDCSRDRTCPETHVSEWYWTPWCFQPSFHRDCIAGGVFLNRSSGLFLVIHPSSFQIRVWRSYSLHLWTGSRRSALWQRWYLPFSKIRGHSERTGCRKCQTLPGLHCSWNFLLLSAPNCLFCSQIQNPSREVKEKQLKWCSGKIFRHAVEGTWHCLTVAGQSPVPS